MKRVSCSLVLVSAACTLLLSACSPQPGEMLELTSDDNGSEQTLSVGQRMSISLDSNPTTGYRWDVDGDIPPQLTQVGEPEYAADSTALGAAGTEVWTFEGSSRGRAIVRLKYWRSFEPDTTPAEQFEVSIEVR